MSAAPTCAANPSTAAADNVFATPASCVFHRFISLSQSKWIYLVEPNPRPMRPSSSSTRDFAVGDLFWVTATVKKIAAENPLKL
jgi:hypothetical protein